MRFLKNRHVLVVGGTEGLGLELARLAVRAGAHVGIIARREERLKTVCAFLENDKCNKAQKILWQSADVTNNEQLVRASENILQGFEGVIDFLINSAGIAIPGYLEDLTSSQLTQMMDVNFSGSVSSCKWVLPFMKKQRRGHIINVTSVAGFIGLFGYTGYCGSKFALQGFSEALKREVEPWNIRVSIVCPPNMNTPGFVEENKTKPQEVLKIESKAKLMEPAIVAKDVWKKIGKNKEIILSNFESSLAYWLSRHIPKLLNCFVKRPTPTNF